MTGLRHRGARVDRRIHSIPDTLRRILTEPLLHFLLLGAAIFAAYSLMNKGAGNDPGKIVVTQGQLAALGEGFFRTWQRPATSEEMQGLVRQRVQEEVYYREALALGLDKDDLIIRRRLRQKLEFVSHDLAAPAEPGDAQLQAYLDAHASSFAIDPRLSFRQVYLDPQRHGANLARDGGRLLATLQQAGAEADLKRFGDPLLPEHDFDNASLRDVGSLFGEKFVAALGRVPTGQWQGPVESGYGVHMVFVSARTAARLPALDDVREAVRREWGRERQREADDRYYRTLLEKYAVSVEPPASASAAATGAPDSLAVR